MPKYRHRLPQLDGKPFLTDSGLETTLIFHEGLELPHFAAFDLLRDEAGTEILRRYFRRHAEIARQRGAGFILESATWRSSPDWADKLGYSPEDLDRVNRAAIDLLVDVRWELETPQTPMVISACVGPRGDGYDPEAIMEPAEAEDYHAVQIGTFADTAADQVTAITMTSANEAIGVARAARRAGLPVVIAFTVETDGRLPTGQSVRDAIEEVDAATENGPAYYMINCAHPTHFDGILEREQWITRLKGLRANASRRSHVELDEAGDLDDGDPVELGRQYAELLERFPHINVLGGCCGTDHRHIEQIGAVCLKAA